MTITPSALRRTRIEPADLPPGAVLIDQRRSRTAWYEGQFVTAEDFNRDQSYLLTRQADIGRSIGKGVVEGLEAAAAPDGATAVIVEPGIGLGGAGETIVVHQAARLDLADIATQRAIGRQAGLVESLGAPLETRTGLFVLAATPVEYTSNPVGAYPTSMEGERRMEDSLVTEAVLFTLAPFPLPGDESSAADWRARAARRIFVEGAEPALPSASLPLAMVALQGNVVLWVDGPMVRREAGAARADVEGLGVVDEARAIAHFRQFDARIAALVAARPGRGVPAHEAFEALPPMGRMPAACVAPRSPAPGVDAVLSQSWLPARMPVELVALPEDEIEVLLRESLTLPPIDLSASEGELANTPVTIIAAVPREDWATTPAELQETAQPLAAPTPLGGAPTSPSELLRTLLSGAEPPAPATSAVDPRWQALLAGRTTLWCLRRRQFQRSDTLVGEASAYAASGVVVEEPPPVEPPPPVDAPPPADAALLEAQRRAFERATADRLAGLGLREARALEAVEDPRLALRLAEAMNDAAARGGALMAESLLAEIARLGPRPDGDGVARLVERYGREAGPLRAMEPALYAAPFRILLPAAAAGNDPERAAAFLAEMGGFDARTAARLAAAPPVLVPPAETDDPAFASKVLDAAAGAEIVVELPAADPSDEETAKRRAQLAAAGVAPELDAALREAGPQRAARLVEEVQAIFDELRDDPAALAGTLGERLGVR